MVCRDRMEPKGTAMNIRPITQMVPVYSYYLSRLAKAMDVSDLGNNRENFDRDLRYILGQYSLRASETHTMLSPRTDEQAYLKRQIHDDLHLLYGNSLEPQTRAALQWDPLREGFLDDKPLYLMPRCRQYTSSYTGNEANAHYAQQVWNDALDTIAAHQSVVEHHAVSDHASPVEKSQAELQRRLHAIQSLDPVLRLVWGTLHDDYDKFGAELKNRLHLQMYQAKDSLKRWELELLLLQGDVYQLQLKREELLRTTYSETYSHAHLLPPGHRLSDETALRQALAKAVENPLGHTSGVTPSSFDLGL